MGVSIYQHESTTYKSLNSWKQKTTPHNGIIDWLIGLFVMFNCLFFGAPTPSRFSGKFEDCSFRMKTKMKICPNLHWRIKVWRTQISGLLKNEDYNLPHLLKRKIAFLELLKTEDLKSSIKNVKKMKTMSCAGSPIFCLTRPRRQGWLVC